MSNSTSRASAARCTLAALSFAAVAATAQQAEAAVTRVLVQQQVNVSCGGGTCRADFIDLPANQALDVTRVWCEVFTTGTVWRAQVYGAPAQPIFAIPLDLEWQRSVGNTNTRAYTFSAEPGMRVGLGKQLTVVLSYESGSPVGSCAFTGVRLTVT